jgi:hypothetical protein
MKDNRQQKNCNNILVQKNHTRNKEPAGGESEWRNRDVLDVEESLFFPLSLVFLHFFLLHLPFLLSGVRLQKRNVFSQPTPNQTRASWTLPLDQPSRGNNELKKKFLLFFFLGFFSSSSFFRPFSLFRVEGKSRPSRLAIFLSQKLKSRFLVDKS